MVQIGDFEVQLVDADNDTKAPFKEHPKDGKVFVEAEPDAEYFISVRKVNETNEQFCLHFTVDGTALGYSQSFGRGASAEPTYRGLWSRTRGVSTHKALKFVKSIGGGGANAAAHGAPAMGQVKVDVFLAVYAGQSHVHSDYSSSFATAAVSGSGSLAQKKNLRSGEGTASFTTAVESGPQNRFTAGEHRYTITLNYCAAVGLIAVGVLSKPPLWTHHRMLHPAKKGDVKDEVKVGRTDNGSELLDLAGKEGDDSDDEDVADGERENALQPPKKKAKEDPAGRSPY